MNTIERLRPELRPLDAEWSNATLQAILASPGAQLDHVKALAASRRTQRPIGRRLAAMTAAAAIAGAVVTGVVGLRPDPAFAVERQADGDIAVTVVKLDDADDLERALADKGITAEVIYHANALKPSNLDDGSSDPGCRPVGLTVDPAENGGFTFTLDARYVATRNSVLHLDAAGGRTSGDWTAVSVRWEDSTC